MFRGLSDAHVLAAARWLPVTNSTGSAIPEFSLVRVTASSTAGVFTAAQPNADGGMVWATGPGEIPAGGTGVATPDFPAYVAYDSGDGTPAVGETWGAGNGSWVLNKNNAGFRVCGNPDTSLVIVPVERDFTAASAGSIQVEDVDESPSVSSVTQLRFDSGDGFVVSSPGAGIARVDQTAASGSVVGYVNLAAQHLGTGEKTVDELGLSHTSGGTAEYKISPSTWTSGLGCTWPPYVPTVLAEGTAKDSAPDGYFSGYAVVAAGWIGTSDNASGPFTESPTYYYAFFGPGAYGNFVVGSFRVYDPSSRATAYVIGLDGSTGIISCTGGFQPPHMADASAANDTIYYSTTAGKLVYKDSGGTVNNLY